MRQEASSKAHFPRGFKDSLAVAAHVAVCLKRTTLNNKARMSRFSAIAALFITLILCLPGNSGGQLFSRDPNAAIYRAAKRYNLAALEKIDPGIYVDLRYSVTSASGYPLYLPNMPCLIHKSTGEKLKKVNTQLRDHGYALKIWDAWRPPEAHQALWNAVRDPRFVVPPSKGLSWHCYGVSVDVTLVQLDGTPVLMPSPFDEFSERAASNYRGGDAEIAERVTLLQTLMKNAGFRTIESEWWHFDDMKATGGVRKVTAKDLGIPMPG